MKTFWKTYMLKIYSSGYHQGVQREVPEDLHGESVPVTDHVIGDQDTALDLWINPDACDIHQVKKIESFLKIQFERDTV